MSRLWASLRRAFGWWTGAANPQSSEGALLSRAVLPADPEPMLDFLRGLDEAAPQPSEDFLLTGPALPADMDEASWLACTDPEPMLDFLRGRASDRKLRLSACACCGPIKRDYYRHEPPSRPVRRTVGRHSPGR